jgi:hypothetical protein
VLSHRSRDSVAPDVCPPGWTPHPSRHLFGCRGMDRGIEGLSTPWTRSWVSKADLCPASGFLALCGFCLERYEMRLGVSSAYCWFPVAPASVHKPLERPIAPLVVTASVVAKGFFESGRCRTGLPGCRARQFDWRKRRRLLNREARRWREETCSLSRSRSVYPSSSSRSS